MTRQVDERDKGNAKKKAELKKALGKSTQDGRQMTRKGLDGVAKRTTGGKRKENKPYGDKHDSKRRNKEKEIEDGKYELRSKRNQAKWAKTEDVAEGEGTLSIAMNRAKAGLTESKQINEGVLDEHDDDGFMAKRQLYDLAKYSVQLHKMIQDDDNLEPWVQAKITKAADYIDTVKHYLEYKGLRGAEDAAIDFGMDDIADVDSELDVMEGPGVGAPDYNPAASSYNSGLERGDEIITTDGEHTGVIKKIDGEMAHVEFYSSGPNGEWRDVVPLSTLEFNEYANSEEEAEDLRRLGESRGTAEEIMARMFAPLKGRK